jgi:hypothetical protein
MPPMVAEPGSATDPNDGIVWLAAHCWGHFVEDFAQFAR